MEKFMLKDQTMNKSQLQKIYNYPINPRKSKIFSDEGFVNFDDGSMGRTVWTCFCIKDKKSFNSDSFGANPEKVYLSNYMKPTNFNIYKKKDLNSNLCGSFC